MLQEDISASSPKPDQPIHIESSNGTLKEEGTHSNRFEKALQSWAEIDLPNLQKTLDEQGVTIKDQQKISLLSRKELATKTKEFKKLDDDNKLESFKSLLKLYQNEIDSLTKKSKSLEGYFFGVYRSIGEAPDPKPLLEVSLDAVYNSTETDTLKEELNKLNLRLSRVADYDQIKDRLLRTEQRSAELLSTRLASKEEEFKALIDEKERNWSQKEIELTRQVNEARKQVEEIRTTQQVTELKLNNHNKELGNNDGDYKNTSSILSELELVTRDAEASQVRVLQLEKRNEELRRDLSVAKSGIEKENLKEMNANKLSEIESENALLVSRLEHQRRSFETSKTQDTNKLDSLNREVNQLTSEVRSLKGKLANTSDYDEIKSELAMLKHIELGLGDDDDDGAKNSEVDSMLVSRNRKLTKELTEFRSTHESLINKINGLETQLSSSTAEFNRLRDLNVRLENDLADFNEIRTGNKFETMSVISGVSRMGASHSMVPKSNRNGGRVSPASSIAGGLFPESSQQPQQDPSILPIVVKQRDRFRNRNKELEEELKKQFQLISDLKRNVGKLKKDNDQLYERIRYLSSFENQNQNKSTKRRETIKPTEFIKTGDIENNYQQTYEERLHPIERFRLQEQERINAKLSPLERIFISFARAILATRASRMLFMCYCLGLHCVVMTMTVYVMSLSTSLMPEVGMNSSTGGFAGGNTGNVAEPH